MLAAKPAPLMSLWKWDEIGKRLWYTFKVIYHHQIATFLINLTTNIRIWRALNVEKNLDIIKEILDAGSNAGDECGVCSCPDMLVLKHGSGIDLSSMDLNESQINAVLSSIATSTCSHKSSVRLIWGPPGTGKIKTIVTMLWVLLGMKCRTLTCAPTNIAVMQVASRLLKLVKGTIRKDQYGLGDIVLSGNEKRMKFVKFGFPLSLMWEQTLKNHNQSRHLGMK